MLKDPPRPRDRQVTLTRGHLYALMAMSIALASVTFFLGMQIGRREVPTVEQPATRSLVGEEARTGDLEVLLTKVEQARPGAQPFEFPQTLPQTVPPPMLGTEAMVPAGAAISPQNGTVPRSGWSIEVSTWKEAEEADQELERLVKGGLAAYRVTALIDGRPSHRVRIGGYPTEAKAMEELEAVSKATRAAEARVVQSP